MRRQKPAWISCQLISPLEMAIFRLQILIVAAIIACEGEELRCRENSMKNFYLLEGEAFIFKLRGIRGDLHDHAFKWHKNGTPPEPIFTYENQSVHYHNKALFFLGVKPEHAGVYTARFSRTDGECSNYYVNIHVLKSERDTKLWYGRIESSDTNVMVSCPGPIASICDDFNGIISWKKDFSPLVGRSKKNWWISNASEEDEGVYTCVCTWMHNQTEYQSSGSRRISKVSPFSAYQPKILSPEDSEMLADEGLLRKLNCTVFCGRNVPRCEAGWKINGRSIPADGYSTVTHTVMKNISKDVDSTAVLTIDKVSAKDFQATFTCSGRSSSKSGSKNITLIRREKSFGLAVHFVGVFLSCLFVAVLLKCFTIDIVLLFRPCMSLTTRKKDTRIYDAYVIYQMRCLDNATEKRLSLFITKILPSVLESKCGYRLFIHERDDIPGEAHLETVESCIQQSKRLMVILTPSSASELTDQHPARPQSSEMRGFDWQIVLHHALVQSEMGVILIQIGEAGPGGFSYLPPGLQYLIRKNPPIRWRPELRCAATRNSRFWKKVRYLMPAVPATKR